MGGNCYPRKRINLKMPEETVKIQSNKQNYRVIIKRDMWEDVHIIMYTRMIVH